MSARVLIWHSHFLLNKSVSSATFSPVLNSTGLLASCVGLTQFSRLLILAAHLSKEGHGYCPALTGMTRSLHRNAFIFLFVVEHRVSITVSAMTSTVSILFSRYRVVSPCFCHSSASPCVGSACGSLALALCFINCTQYSTVGRDCQ